MKLENLIQREKFPDIFCATLGKYLQQTSSWSGEVVWGCHGSNNDLNFLVNAKLNLIYPVFTPQKDLIPLATEYAFHSNFIKRWAQNAYIFLALHPLLRRFFSSFKLHITDKSSLISNLCILPGNHTIRIISLDESECVVITKEGFGGEKLKNAASTRLSYPELPGPKVLFFENSVNWYVEERIFGLPIDRCANQREIDKALKAAKVFLRNMYNSTTSSVVAADYLKLKYTEIDDAINSLPECYQQSDIMEIIKIKTDLFDIATTVIKHDALILTSHTHGDFQDANILVPTNSDTREVYIIDWEYADVRCQHYDWFVYGLKSRSPKDLSGRINELMSDNDQSSDRIDWCELSGINSEELRVLVYLFLIEELLFRLDDTNTPNLSKKSEGFLLFIYELSVVISSNSGSQVVLAA